MIFFRYRRHLEAENLRLRNQVDCLNQELMQIRTYVTENERLRAQNDKLIEALVPSLKPRPTLTAGDIVADKKRSHKIEISGQNAKCSCGWNQYSNDPATLQSEVDQHYRNNNATPVKFTRKTWPQLRDELESRSVNEAKA